VSRGCWWRRRRAREYGGVGGLLGGWLGGCRYARWARGERALTGRVSETSAKRQRNVSGRWSSARMSPSQPEIRAHWGSCGRFVFLNFKE